MINANNLIIGTTSQPAAIGAKPNRMNRPTVIAHMAQLFRTRVFCIRRITDSLHAPDTYMAISRRRRDTAPIRRDVAGVDLEILLLAWSSVSIHSPMYWGSTSIRESAAKEEEDVPLCVSQAGRMKCMIARLVWDWHGTFVGDIVD